MSSSGGARPPAASPAVGGDGLARVLSLFDASMLIVASVVGAGIFLTPGQVATLLPSATLILLVWTAGALLSLAGAVSNAELAAMFPKAGGDYVYLREGLHPGAGFLVGWLSFFAIYSGTIAALAAVLGEAAASAWLGAEAARTAPAAGPVASTAASALGRDGVRIGAAAIVILVCSALNVRGVRLGAQATNVTSVLKIAAILAFVGFGFGIGEGDFSAWRPAVFQGGGTAGSGVTDAASAPLAVRFGTALSPVLFSFLGWNASVYVASEIEHPERNVPLSLFWGLGLCTALYVAVNGVYFYALSPEALGGARDAGAAAAEALFGPAAGRWVALFVLISVLGTLNATILTGPRVAFAMALDGLFWRPANRVHAGFRTPSVAIWVQAVVAIALVALLENFPNALDFTVFAIVLATSADVVALFALRWRQPGRPRPVRAWGYPWVPGLYLVANAGIALSMIVSQPRECGIAAAVLAAGLLMYCMGFRGRMQPRPEP